jgi:hypothetical protein
MNREKKTCQNCKAQFTIEPEDFAFYEKIKVPPPTFCPECRMQRRFSWRNERSLYRVKCSKSNKNIISGFSHDSNMTVYDRDLWWSDKWDPFEYSQDYDFSKPFFWQFNELMHRVPMPAVFNARTVNCEFTQHTGDSKNCYLLVASWDCENISYAARTQESKDSMDIFAAANCELCFESISVSKLYRTFFSQDSANCDNSFLLYDCRGCSNCFGCTNLRNKSYFIFNEPYSKEAYFKKLVEFDTGSYSKLQILKKKFSELKLRALRKYANIVNSLKITGDNITNTNNCSGCFDVANDIRDCKFIQNALHMKDSYDGYGVGASAELLYEVFDTGIQGARLCFGGILYGGMDVYYSYNCHGSQNLFGSIGLRQKQYCILNRQYTKEEYERLVPRIIEHMNEMPYVDKRGRVYKYGEFFPTELSPFAYNETVAQEYFPLTKEEAENQGYTWKDPEPRTYEITLQSDDLPDHIKDVTDSILKEVIQCAHAKGSPSDSSGQIADAICNEQCTTAFRIIPQELEFYQKMNLPLPRLCPNCRHYQRIKQRNPLKLWHRTCTCNGTESGVTNQESGYRYTNTSTHFHKDQPCPNEFETSYAPEREEIVYCEECYQQEVV